MYPFRYPGKIVRAVICMGYDLQIFKAIGKKT